MPPTTERLLATSLAEFAVRPHDVIAQYKLPTEVRYCVRCTISNQRPRIGFDADGVCSACRYAESKRTTIDWAARERELHALCDRYRRTDGSYDVIVPSSGGKDSSFVAYELKYTYGMHPLTVTWSPHLHTDIGFRNWQQFIDVGGFDNILGRPNGRTHRTLTRLAFEILGDPFQPFIYGQTHFPMQIAVRYGIPLIMYGENGEVEYGGDMKNAFRPNRDWRTDHAVHYFSGLPPEDLVRYGVARDDLVAYVPPPVEQCDRLGLDIHFMGYYRLWTPQEHYYLAAERCGFTANPERSEGTYSKYASLDDRFDGFHYYLGFIKFGIGRATSDTAHEIRDGHLTREEGVRLVRKYDGEFPQKHFREFLEYCGISEEHFCAVVDSWRSPHLWERVSGAWRLQHRVS